MHAPHAPQEALSAQGFWIYDFILPYAVLEALLTGEASLLRGRVVETRFARGANVNRVIRGPSGERVREEP